jgi:hypothetical protein
VRLRALESNVSARGPGARRRVSAATARHQQHVAGRSPSEIVASPSELSASPSELSASPSELSASPSELSASPSELSASPSELLAITHLVRCLRRLRTPPRPWLPLPARGRGEISAVWFAGTHGSPHLSHPRCHCPAPRYSQWSCITGGVPRFRAVNDSHVRYALGSVVNPSRRKATSRTESCTDDTSAVWVVADSTPHARLRVRCVKKGLAARTPTVPLGAPQSSASRRARDAKCAATCSASYARDRAQQPVHQGACVAAGGPRTLGEVAVSAEAARERNAAVSVAGSVASCARVSARRPRFALRASPASFMDAAAGVGRR